MKIIVTGSCGIIGSQIVNDLKNKDGINIVELDFKYGNDLTDEQYVKSFFSDVNADAVINCFVINDHIQSDSKKKSFLDYPLDSFEKSLKVNVTALFSVCREFIRNNKSGKIINFSSIYGYRSPRPSLYSESGGDKDPAYGPSKAAVSNLTKYLATHATNFQINCIVPGGVENGQTNSFQNKYCEDLPISRMMTKKEIVGSVSFLLSEDSS